MRCVESEVTEKLYLLRVHGPITVANSAGYASTRSHITA